MLGSSGFPLSPVPISEGLSLALALLYPSESSLCLRDDYSLSKKKKKKERTTTTATAGSIEVKVQCVF